MSAVTVEVSGPLFKDNAHRLKSFFFLTQPDLERLQVRPTHTLYLLLLDPIFNLLGGGLVRSEQTDGARKLWVQDVPIFVPDHQVQIQVPSKI